MSAPACIVHTSLSPLLVYTLKQCPLMPLEYGRFLELSHKMAADLVQTSINPLTTRFKDYYNKAAQEEGDTKYKAALTSGLEALRDIKDNLLSPLHMNIWELKKNYDFARTIGEHLESILTFTKAHFEFTKPLLKNLSDLHKNATELSNRVAKDTVEFQQAINQLKPNNTATS